MSLSDPTVPELQPPPEAQFLIHQSEQLAESGDWAGSLDSARRANFLLFQLQFPGTHSAIVRNYLTGALALLNLHEWHESAILANLSLKGLESESDKPSRAGALILLAKALQGHRDLNGARAALHEFQEILASGNASEIDQVESAKLARDLDVNCS